MVCPPTTPTPTTTTHANKSGKNWHDTKKAFRPNAGLTSYEKRKQIQDQQKAVKELEREMKEEKEAERQVSSPYSMR